MTTSTSCPPRTKQAIVIFPSSTQLSQEGLFPPQPLSASTQLIKKSTLFQRQKLALASTELQEPTEALSAEIEAIFWIAKGEFFEDGIESTFSRQFNSFVKRHGNDALEAITCLIVYERVDEEIAGEALRWLSRIDDAETYKYRRWLLERSLGLSSTRVRDGAILGIASMDDKHAIPYLKSAIEKERCLELKADMESVLEQLEC